MKTQTTPTSAVVQTPDDKRLSNGQALTLALLFVGYAGYYICRVHLASTRSSIIDEYHAIGINKAWIGQMTGTATGFYAFGKFCAGPLSDRFGGRTMFLIGMAAAILCTVAFGLSTTMIGFTVAWTLNRFLQSLGWAGLVKTMSRWFPYRKYGGAMGLINMSFLLGDFAPKLAYGAMLNAGLGWRSIFFVAAAALSVIFVVVFLFLKGSPRDIGLEEPPSSPSNVFGGEESPQSPLQIVGRLLSNPAFWTVCVLSFGFTFMRETFNDWTPTYLHEVGKMSEGDASYKASLFPLFGAISVVGVGWLSDKLKKGGRAIIMVVGLLLGTISLGALATWNFSGDSNLLVAVVASIAFLLLGPYSLLAGAISLDMGGKQASATACGWIDGVGYVGGILSGVWIGKIAEKQGWAPAFWVLAVTSFISFLFAALYYIQDRKSPVSSG